MSRLHSLEGREAEDVGLVVETHENNKSSMLYRVLPAIVQNRMPILPSLRRSVSEYRTRGIPSSTTSLSENLPETPPPLYTSRPVSSSNTPLRPLSVASTSLFDVEDDISVASSALTTVYETLTGISWQHAKHGMPCLFTDYLCEHCTDHGRYRWSDRSTSTSKRLMSRKRRRACYRHHSLAISLRHNSTSPEFTSDTHTGGTTKPSCCSPTRCPRYAEQHTRIDTER
jgi:hypothetical protein